MNDLLDDTPEDDEPRPKRPRGEKARIKPLGSPGKADARVVQALLQPVSITFLAQVLGMERRTVNKRLANLPPVGQHRGQTPLYDFRQAMQYLVTPKVDIAEAIKKMGTDDLPVSLQKDVWDAKLKSQKWMLNAGELWRTEDVLEVLGEAFQRLKTTTQLWIDQVGDNHMLSVEARKELTELVDALQQDLHRSLVKMPEEKATKAQIAQLEEDGLDG